LARHGKPEPVEAPHDLQIARRHRPRQVVHAAAADAYNLRLPGDGTDRVHTRSSPCAQQTRFAERDFQKDRSPPSALRSWHGATSHRPPAHSLRRPPQRRTPRQPLPEAATSTASSGWGERRSAAPAQPVCSRPSLRTQSRINAGKASTAFAHCLALPTDQQRTRKGLRGQPMPKLGAFRKTFFHPRDRTAVVAGGTGGTAGSSGDFWWD
jgi:hypothetical protein